MAANLNPSAPTPQNLDLKDDRLPQEEEKYGSASHTTDRSLSDGSVIKPSPASSHSTWQRMVDVLCWSPPWCRWNPESPPTFNIWTNLMYGAAGTFTVANLYYNQPILNVLARDFHVTNEQSSYVPTLAQVGYVVGLFFFCPLGDLVRRRQFTLGMILFTAIVWIGLCITNNFQVFLGLTFITGTTTITPQIMAPLVGDLAPPHRRATALAITGAGNTLGILVARILAGVVANYISWRYVYWIAFAEQLIIFSLLWMFMPDYPCTNKKLNYFHMLWDVLRMFTKYPVLVQSGLSSGIVSAVFTSYWTTQTFLLAGPPYNFNSLYIGLFALVGMAGMICGPLAARTIIDNYVPLFSALVFQLIGLVGTIIGTYTGEITVAGPIIFAFLLDVSFMVVQIANRSAIYTVEPRARNRINTSYMVCVFLGQITGTTAGNKLYAQGGWIASGSLSVGLTVFAIFCLLARGPWEEGWIGWSGGWQIKKKNKLSADGKTHEIPHLMNRDEADRYRAAHAAEVPNTEKALETMAAEDGMNPARVVNENLEGSHERQQDADQKV